MKNTALKNLFIKASENELSEAVGGVSLKGIRNSVIIGVSALLGGEIGVVPGVVTGGMVGVATGDIKYDKKNNELILNEHGETIVNTSALVGHLSGTLIGVAIGRKIVNYLDSW